MVVIVVKMYLVVEYFVVVVIVKIYLVVEFLCCMLYGLGLRCVLCNHVPYCQFSFSHLGF